MNKKEYKNIDEQIEHLVINKNVIKTTINKQDLINNSYLNVITPYTSLVAVNKVNNNHLYDSNVDFNQFSTLYNLDKMISTILRETIGEFELSLKSYISNIYCFKMHYIGDTTCSDYNIFHEYINGAINSQLWNKLVRTELLRCDDFKTYSVEFNFGEDAAMSLMLLFNARIVSKVSGAFYHYLERENSLSRIYTTQQCGDFIEMISFYEKYIGDKGLLDKYREEIETKEIEVKFLILKNSDRQTQKRFYRAFDNLTSRIWQRCKLGAHNKLALYLASVGYLKCANFIWYTTKFLKFIMRE